MAGLVPAIHAFFLRGGKDVDARDRPGHDGGERCRLQGSIALSARRRAGMDPRTSPEGEGGCEAGPAARDPPPLYMTARSTYLTGRKRTTDAYAFMDTIRSV